MESDTKRTGIRMVSQGIDEIRVKELSESEYAMSTKFAYGYIIIQFLIKVSYNFRQVSGKIKVQ